MTPSDQHRIDQETIETLAAAVSKAIESNHGNKRFIDLERIPLICLGIANMSNDLKEMKEMMASNRRESDLQHESFLTKSEFTPYRKAMNMIAGLVLIAIVTGLLALVILKP